MDLNKTVSAKGFKLEPKMALTNVQAGPSLSKSVHSAQASRAKNPLKGKSVGRRPTTALYDILAEPAKLSKSRSSSASVLPKVGTPRETTTMLLSKLNHTRGKICLVLKELEITLNEVSAASSDDDEEGHRKKRRANEFSARFSRNNLYQMSMSICSLKKSLLRPDTIGLEFALLKDIVLTYNIALQTLQTYSKHVVSAQSIDIPDKAQQALGLMLELDHSCKHIIHVSGDKPVDGLLVDDGEVQKRCQVLIGALHTHIPKELDLKSVPKKILQGHNKDSARFSMYQKSVGPEGWKSKVQSLARAKFGPPKLRVKRKKKATLDKAQKDTFDIYTQKLDPMYGKYLGNKFIKFDASKVLPVQSGPSPRAVPAPRKKRRAPCPVTTIDRDVETVMQTITKDRVESNASSREDDSEASVEVDNLKLKNSLLKVVQNLDGDKLERDQAIVQLLTTIDAGGKKHSRENVKLIHVKSKDMMESTVESKEEKREEAECVVEVIKEEGNKIRTEENEEMKRESCLMELHERLKEKEDHAAQQRLVQGVFFRSVHCYRGPRNEACKGKVQLKTFNEKEIAHYKKQFREYCRNNVMYRKSNLGKPWSVVAKISTRLVSDVLAEIIKSIDDTTLVHKLYYNELLEDSNFM